MTSAGAFRLLAELQREGWFVAILPGLAGQVIVQAALGDRDVRRQGDHVADVAGDLAAECRHWWPSNEHVGASALQLSF